MGKFGEGLEKFFENYVGIRVWSWKKAMQCLTISTCS
jgi:hypothetical protein